jgi:hypothetical protein
MALSVIRLLEAGDIVLAWSPGSLIGPMANAILFERGSPCGCRMTGGRIFKVFTLDIWYSRVAILVWIRRERTGRQTGDKRRSDDQGNHCPNQPGPNAGQKMRQHRMHPFVLASPLPMRRRLEVVRTRTVAGSVLSQKGTDLQSLVGHTIEP